MELPFLILLSVQAGFGLKCYSCMSNVNTGCADPFEGNADFFKNCSSSELSSTCFRTSVRNRTTGHTVTTRGCGSCDRTPTSYDMNVLNCIMCEDDGCNGANVFVLNFARANSPKLFPLFFPILLPFRSRWKS